MSLEPWHWLALAGLLAMAEVAAPGFALLWFALGALATALLAWSVPQAGWEWQVLFFAAAGVLSAVAWIGWRRRRPETSDAAGLNRPGARLVGRRLQLCEPIERGRGRVRAGDGSWAVSGPDLPAGTEVVVTAAEGSVLTVEPASTGSLDRGRDAG